MRKAIFTILFTIIFMSFVSSVTVVETPSAQTTQPTSTSWFGFLTSPIFWGIAFILFIIVVLAVIVFFVVRFVIKFLQKRNDVFYRMRAERMQLAKIHSRYPTGHFWKINKNVPIRIVKKDERGELYISKPIAYHRGDYMTHEGNQIISLNLEGRKKFFFFPVRDLLIIPNREKIKIFQRDDTGHIIKTEEFTVPTAKDIVQFRENEILLFCEGISSSGLFIIPVLKSKEGKILDLSLPIYATMKETMIGDYLYEQSTQFVTLSKKAVDMNVDIRGKTKLMDSNNAVEVQRQEN